MEYVISAATYAQSEGVHVHYENVFPISISLTITQIYINIHKHLFSLLLSMFHTLKNMLCNLVVLRIVRTKL